MPKSDDDYTAALEPGPANNPHVQALDKAEREAEQARLDDRVRAFSRRMNRRGGANPHTGL